MKAKLRNSAALVTLALIGSASADIIYSNLQNTAIPTGSWTGVTITVNGGSINPFFGGVGVANDPLLQPARTGTDPLDAILNLSAGTLISSSNGALNFSTGAGGSETHLGSTFTAQPLPASGTSTSTKVRLELTPMNKPGLVMAASQTRPSASTSILAMVGAAICLPAANGGTSTWVTLPLTASTRTRPRP